MLPVPAIHFGAGMFARIAEYARPYGRNVLLVTGSGSLQRQGYFHSLLDSFSKTGMQYAHIVVDHEPSPELIDHAVACFGGLAIDVVISVGGGSVIDAGKAIAAMLPSGDAVERYVEGLPGSVPHDGRKVSFIAVPTTSGTGSEVTSNAVISRTGKNGFKRSLRHQSFVPDVAVVDPLLMCSASRELTAASGMDACTQLLEAYVSPSATPFTDLLAFHGLEYFTRSFLPACFEGAEDIAVRADLAYAALLSGVVLSNAGLGVVHGFASSVGGEFDIPHGMLCATLLAEATRKNIHELLACRNEHPALKKYARVGQLFSGRVSTDCSEGCNMLIEKLEEWQQKLEIPRLAAFGIGIHDTERLASRTRSKSNPVDLSLQSMQAVLAARV
ncbi:MAG: iron-containing alcohol dehydrogenase [Chlorobiaceae bacterium]|nr:iron-containing alcohol dehydrogenase [Chlorobiaceae bacterium]NTW64602.1 iron-containing alcohol dehydrogenase [Chlorobiaceae bacterium]